MRSHLVILSFLLGIIGLCISVPVINCTATTIEKTFSEILLVLATYLIGIITIWLCVDELEAEKNNSRFVKIVLDFSLGFGLITMLSALIATCLFLLK